MHQKLHYSIQYLTHLQLKYKIVVIINKLKMNSETKFMSHKISHDKIDDSKDRTSAVTTDSESYRLSDSSEDAKQLESCADFQNNLLSKKFFQQRVSQSEISQILHKKAINWLITFCWTRNYSEQILWYSVGLYYSYSYGKQIKKQRLNLILLSAVNIALKLYQPICSLGLNDMKNLLNNVWTINDFRDVQSQFVKLFDFDLYFPTLLHKIYSLQLSEDQTSKILFLAQTLFMNNYQSAINDLLLQDILILINQEQSENELKLQIMKLNKNPNTLQSLKQKFSSKFNIDELMDKILRFN